MTPKRIAALEWFHERGEVGWFRYDDNPPSETLRKRMIKDGQLKQRRQGDLKPILFSLTDKGRRELHEATK